MIYIRSNKQEEFTISDGLVKRIHDKIKGVQLIIPINSMNYSDKSINPDNKTSLEIDFNQCVYSLRESKDKIFFYYPKATKRSYKTAESIIKFDDIPENCDRAFFRLSSPYLRSGEKVTNN